MFGNGRVISCVSKIMHILSVIHYTICGAVCFQFTHFPCDDWDNMYCVLLSSSNRKHELLPLFRVRSWNNGVRCMSFYIPTHYSGCNYLSMLALKLIHISEKGPRWQAIKYCCLISSISAMLLLQHELMIKRMHETFRSCYSYAFFVVFWTIE